MDLPGLFTEIAFRHMWQGLLIIGVVSLLLSGRQMWSAEHRSWFWTACLVLSAALPFLTLIDLPQLNFGGSDVAAGGALAAPAPVTPVAEASVFDPAFLASIAGLVDQLPLGLILSLLVSVWLGVMVWKLFRIAAAARQTRDLEATLEPCPLSMDMVPADWPEEIEIMQSGAVGTPMAIGFFNCRVVLPSRLVSTLPPHQICHVLSHELAHIRRGDLQFSMIQRVIEAMFWWSPLTWFIGARLRDEREMACDDRAVRMNGCSRQYASALLESVTVLVAGRRKHHCDVLAMSAFDHHSGGAFRTRIRRLIQQGYRAQTSIGHVQIAGFSTAALAVLALFVLSPRNVFDSHALQPSRTRLVENTRPGAFQDENVLVEFSLPTPASLAGLSSSTESVRIMRPQLAVFSRSSSEPPAPPAASAFPRVSASVNAGNVTASSASSSTDECTDDDLNDHGVTDLDGAGRKVTVFAAVDARNVDARKLDVRNGDARREDARANQKIPDLPRTEVFTETQVIAAGQVASSKASKTTTEVIITTEENGVKTVRRMVRESDARVLTITDRDGTTLTMTIGEDGNGNKMVSVNGGPGQVVTFD